MSLLSLGSGGQRKLRPRSHLVAPRLVAQDYHPEDNIREVFRVRSLAGVGCRDVFSLDMTADASAAARTERLDSFGVL